MNVDGWVEGSDCEPVTAFNKELIMTEKDHYTIPEAAKRCAVGRTTMWRWVKSGKVKAVATPGGQHRIWKSDLQFLLSQLESPATSDPKKMAHEKPSRALPARVLVVDDDASMRKMLIRILQKHGFQTDVAVDGFEAGLKVMDFNSHVIVLDLVMPGMDGFEVCKRIKENPATSHIKVLAVSGYDTPENREKILKAGADGFLAKPVDNEAFLDEVRRLCLESESELQEALTVG